jgi:hypothetical protein
VTTDNVVIAKLTPVSVNALNYIQKSRGFTETDIVNRALQASELIDRKVDDGWKLAFVKVDVEGEMTESEIMRSDTSD